MMTIKEYFQTIQAFEGFEAWENAQFKLWKRIKSGKRFNLNKWAKKNGVDLKAKYDNGTVVFDWWMEEMEDIFENGEG